MTVAVTWSAATPSARPSTVKAPSVAYDAGSIARQVTGAHSCVPPVVTRTAGGSCGATPGSVTTATGATAVGSTAFTSHSETATEW